jgi:hypothetical protein
MMAELAQTHRVNALGSSIYIKAFSTLLIPTKAEGDMITWHLLFDMVGNRISYYKSKVPQAENIRIQDLKLARHIVGWCSEARTFAGNYNQQINGILDRY